MISPLAPNNAVYRELNTGRRRNAINFAPNFVLEVGDRRACRLSDSRGDAEGNSELLLPEG